MMASIDSEARAITKSLHIDCTKPARNPLL